MAGRGLKETENYFKCFICDVLYSFQLYQDIIKWVNAVTVACHNGKMYIGRQREWRVTDCAKDLDFAAVNNSIGKTRSMYCMPFTFLQVIFEDSVDSFQKIVLRKFHFNPYLFHVATTFGEDPGRPVIMFG